MAAIISSLVGEQLTFDTEKCGKLEDQLLFFFNGSGVSNEDVFSITAGPATWPNASKLEDDNDLIPLITVPVTMLLSQIASYTERALSHSLFLQKGVTFEALVMWFG